MHAHQGETGLILTCEGNQNKQAGRNTTKVPTSKSAERPQQPRRRATCQSRGPRKRPASTAKR
eukprot:3886028-Alexandrium_andersonii.AAC.1